MDDDPTKLDYESPQQPERVPWYKYAYSPVDVTVFLFFVVLIIILGKIFVLDSIAGSFFLEFGLLAIKQQGAFVPAWAD